MKGHAPAQQPASVLSARQSARSSAGGHLRPTRRPPYALKHQGESASKRQRATRATCLVGRPEYLALPAIEGRSLMIRVLLIHNQHECQPSLVVRCACEKNKGVEGKSEDCEALYEIHRRMNRARKM